MSVNGGLVGPQVRSNDVADGQQVNIPALLLNRYYQWGDGVCQVRPEKDVGHKSEPVRAGKSTRTFLRELLG